jgi:hypothetical protein
LRVGPVREATVDELRVADGELPDHDGAIVFDAWTDDAATLVRAAAQEATDVQP